MWSEISTTGKKGLKMKSKPKTKTELKLWFEKSNGNHQISNKLYDALNPEKKMDAYALLLGSICQLCQETFTRSMMITISAIFLFVSLWSAIPLF